jgi:hypothetical protein
MRVQRENSDYVARKAKVISIIYLMPMAGVPGRVPLGRGVCVGQKAGLSGVGIACVPGWGVAPFRSRLWSVLAAEGGGLGCLQAADEGVEAGGEPLVAVV